MEAFIENCYNFFSTPGVVDIFLICSLALCFIIGFFTRTYYQITHLVVFIVLAVVLGIFVAPLLGNFLNKNFFDILKVDTEIIVDGETYTINSLEQLLIIYGQSSGMSKGLATEVALRSANAFGLGFVGLILFVGTPLVSILVYLIIRLFIRHKHFRHNKRWVGGLIGLLHGFINMAIIEIAFGAVCPTYSYLLDSFASLESSGFTIDMIRFMSMFDPQRSYVFGWFISISDLITFHFEHNTYVLNKEVMKIAEHIVKTYEGEVAAITSF